MMLNKLKGNHTLLFSYEFARYMTCPKLVKSKIVTYPKLAKWQYGAVWIWPKLEKCRLFQERHVTHACTLTCTKSTFWVNALLDNCLCLIKICSYSYITIKQKTATESQIWSYVDKYFDSKSHWFYLEVKRVFFSVLSTSI